MTTKIYTRRDSATSALRKAGIKAEEYDQYLKKVDAGFQVELPETQPVGTDGIEATKPKAAKKTKAKKSPKEKKESVASAIRALIKDKKDNAEIWKIIKAKFKLPDTKKHYPSWYRSELNRKKQLK